jgi:hypothetical protein
MILARGKNTWWGKYGENCTWMGSVRGAQSFLRRQSLNCLRISQSFMKNEVSISCLKQSAAGTCPDAADSSPHTQYTCWYDPTIHV